MTGTSSRRALLSVSDKRDLVPFARALESLGFEIVSTGGTARTLSEAGLKVVPIDQVTEADWDLQHTVNLKASFFLNRSVGQVLVRQGTGGRIINFASGAFLTGALSGSDAYVASKGGIVTMTRSFAKQYGPHGILVNCVSPGQIDTPMQHIDNPPEVVEAAIKTCPIRRMGRPDEIASVVVFLASDNASFVSGATINVSGGQTLY
ncbi:MAG: SDR family oxidoreductase [Actinobacteria bacterium]|nr:SDR family oxidoreductase [Actinomycetota bacterium]